MRVYPRVLQSTIRPKVKGKNIFPYPPDRIQLLESKVLIPTLAKQKTAGGVAMPKLWSAVVLSCDVSPLNKRSTSVLIRFVEFVLPLVANEPKPIRREPAIKDS